VLVVNGGKLPMTQPLSSTTSNLPIEILQDLNVPL
jgi:hypothetical protein